MIGIDCLPQFPAGSVVNPGDGTFLVVRVGCVFLDDFTGQVQVVVFYRHTLAFVKGHVAVGIVLVMPAGSDEAVFAGIARHGVGDVEEVRFIGVVGIAEVVYQAEVVEGVAAFIAQVVGAVAPEAEDVADFVVLDEAADGSLSQLLLLIFSDVLGTVGRLATTGVYRMLTHSLLWCSLPLSYGWIVCFHSIRTSETFG